MRIKIFWMKKSFTEFSQWFKAEVEKVKRVSGNLRIGPKTAKMKESDMKKVVFCLQMDFRAT
jgi:hypothetical protein